MDRKSERSQSGFSENYSGPLVIFLFLLLNNKVQYGNIINDVAKFSPCSGITLVFGHLESPRYSEEL